MKIKKHSTTVVADQDSDSLYTTDQPDIVAHAKYCYAHYPTIVNNIPKEKQHYDNTMDDFAKIDNNLAHSQRAIGESSNLAQRCLTYTYNTNEPLFEDDVCVLSVLAQLAIDSSKRRFAVDVTEEIKAIKQRMPKTYPLFWKIIHPEIDNKRINPDLKCPMNALYHTKTRSDDNSITIPISKFYVYMPYNNLNTCSKKVKNMIDKYGIEVNKFNYDDNATIEDYLLLKENYDNLIEELKELKLGKKYQSLISWLINRAFMITSNMKSNMSNTDNRVISQNKMTLLNVLYHSNPVGFLSCFKSSRNTQTCGF